ncbi:UNKNOWN [Stylonychia lemnae]|uniref:Uncharacterized protein n=1 Tax=Stylonychia lemnae TaxID=5949 RepID=A0A078B7S7_STYLE|nr:UNKNOWN [Stylonychia lemnae]|eukprot:CDW90276.1 UNKNOWN [Stylonychia lemnae]
MLRPQYLCFQEIASCVRYNILGAVIVEGSRQQTDTDVILLVRQVLVFETYRQAHCQRARLPDSLVCATLVVLCIVRVETLETIYYGS